MRVLISGAGIAGPTLAWFLAKSGTPVTIVEKADAILAHGQSIDLKGSARMVIKKMGLMDEVRRLHTTEKGTQFIDGQGRPFAPLLISDKNGEKRNSLSLTNELEILRGDLAALLYEATKDDPNTEYLFGTTVREVISNDDRSIKVELSNGEVREFDLLVAADGQWSKVRRQNFPPESVTVVDKDMYTVYYTIPRLPSDNDLWNVYVALGSKIITLRPDPHGAVRAMYTLMPCTETQRREWQAATRSDRKTQQELLRREFHDAGWQATRLLDAMDQAPDWYFQPIQQIKMASWSSGRIICLGDAGYAPSPLTGMGTSLAILGAYVLAGELSKLPPSDDDPSAALHEYERKFRPVVEQEQQIPWFVPGIAHPQSAWKRWVLHVFLRMVSFIVAMPWVSNRLPSDDDETLKVPVYEYFEKQAEAREGGSDGKENVNGAVK